MDSHFRRFQTPSSMLMKGNFTRWPHRGPVSFSDFIAPYWFPTSRRSCVLCASFSSLSCLFLPDFFVFRPLASWLMRFCSRCCVSHLFTFISVSFHLGCSPSTTSSLPLFPFSVSVFLQLSEFHSFCKSLSLLLRSHPWCPGTVCTCVSVHGHPWAIIAGFTCLCLSASSSLKKNGGVKYFHLWNIFLWSFVTYKAA